MSRAVEIPASLANERIDRVVALLSSRSRAQVAELIAGGAVRLQGNVITVRHQRVAAGDVLEIGDDEFDVTPVGMAVSQHPIPFSVVYEDRAIIVVDKPAGVVVHPGAGHRDDTLASGLVRAFPDIAAAASTGELDPSRPGIVHRLDKDTSGLIVIARTRKAYEVLVGQLADRTMGRRYRALVLGTLDADRGLIEAPVGRSTRDRTKMAVQAHGREARTHYAVLERFLSPLPLTEVRATLETGRTHQIRVHFSAIGHPVAGDGRYGGGCRELLLNRPFLHAEELTLIHPNSGKELTFSSPLPDDLAAVRARCS